MKNMLLALCTLFTATQLMAQLPSQPVAPKEAGDTATDNGAFSVQDQSLGSADPDRAIAFENFTLSAETILTGIDWSGVYAEPLPAALSDTDFVVEIWGSTGGVPDLSGPILAWTFEGGPVAGTGGADLDVTPNGIVSNSTGTQVGGGPGFDYMAAIGGTLAAGEYFISIVADQNFDNAAPVVDPEWIWHVGSGTDGFYAADFTNDPAGTPAYGIFQPGFNLAFELKGSVVPEPATSLLALFGFAGLGMFRKRR